MADRLKAKSKRHECAACRKVIRWQLAFCANCTWRGYPFPNSPWPWDGRAHKGNPLKVGKRAWG